MIKKLTAILLLSIFGIHANLFAAIIDPDVVHGLRALQKSFLAAENASNPFSVIIFLKQDADKKTVIKALQQIPDIKIQDLGFMPALAIQMPADEALLQKISKHASIAQISSYKPSSAELDLNAQILKLAPSSTYPDVYNWWAHGYTGKNGVLGLIDTGLDDAHPALALKKMIIRKETGSGYSEYINGVKAPHATGVACIYASNNEKYKGIAFDTPTIIAGLAGEENADISSILQTLSSLDWMLHRVDIKPSIINYSMGNGKLSFTDSPEWSGLAKVMDYVINTQRILWVKSAGNKGYIAPSSHYPFASTLTVPADNYNGLTIANMNPTINENGQAIKIVDRAGHRIMSTSSRGPTPFGRRKPDLSAPGFNTRTCAPDPDVYHIQYTPAMDYQAGYRLMGGTSSAAPHVGASVLLLQDAGIQDPMAIKALLINSADAWTDAGTEDSGHAAIQGSMWNRTYGWGYINMEKAFQQRNHLIQDKLSSAKPEHTYAMSLKPGDKITLVHERRVGYNLEEKPWRLSHLSLEIFNVKTNKRIAIDKSSIDTVHQVSNANNTMDVLVKVKLLSPIDGANFEPFALVHS